MTLAITTAFGINQGLKKMSNGLVELIQLRMDRLNSIWRRMVYTFALAEEIETTIGFAYP